MKLPAACLLMTALLSSLKAEPLPADPLARRCWLSHTAERTALDLREPLAVRFSNLRDGQALRSPLWVEFGVRGMGVARGGTGAFGAGSHASLGRASGSASSSSPTASEA